MPLLQDYIVFSCLLQAALWEDIDSGFLLHMRRPWHQIKKDEQMGQADLCPTMYIYKLDYCNYNAYG